MRLIRPAARAAIARWREVIAAGAVLCVGLWLLSLGGVLFGVSGGGLVAVAISLCVIAFRRMRFAQGGTDPGVVELIEGQISYFGPHQGGSVALSELTEISLVAQEGRRAWRLVQPEVGVLYVPTGATGAETLFDAFISLPGLDGTKLLAALDAPEVAARIVWRRPGVSVRLGGGLGY